MALGSRLRASREVARLTQRQVAAKLTLLAGELIERQQALVEHERRLIESIAADSELQEHRRHAQARLVAMLRQQRKLHASQSTVAKQELGRYPVQEVQWSCFERLYGVTAAWLRGDAESPCADAERASAVLDQLTKLAHVPRSRVRHSAGPPNPRYRSTDHMAGRQLGSADILLRAELSNLICADDAQRLRANWLRYSDIIELPAPPIGSRAWDEARRTQLPCDAEMMLEAAGLTPLCEAILRRGWRAMRALLEMGADPLGRQHVGQCRSLPPLTPWLAALDLEVRTTELVGQPKSDPKLEAVLWPLLKAAVGMHPYVTGPIRDQVYNDEIDLDPLHVKRRVCTPTGGEGGGDLYRAVCRWTGRRTRKQLGSAELRRVYLVAGLRWAICEGSLPNLWDTVEECAEVVPTDRLSVHIG